MKSKIEVREFAINKAVEIMGAGALIKDVVAKAQEIEKYVVGEAELPELSNDVTMAEQVKDLLAQVLTANTGE